MHGDIWVSLEVSCRDAFRLFIVLISLRDQLLFWFKFRRGLGFTAGGRRLRVLHLAHRSCGAVSSSIFTLAALSNQRRSAQLQDGIYPPTFDLILMLGASRRRPHPTVTTPIFFRIRFLSNTSLLVHSTSSPPEHPPISHFLDGCKQAL